jgi:serine O-acetyltransferase
MSSVISKLSEFDTLKEIYHEKRDDDSYPSCHVLREIVDVTRAILFPGFYGSHCVNLKTLAYHIGVNIDHLSLLLREQVYAGFVFGDVKTDDRYRLKNQAKQVVEAFLEKLPELRRLLITDVKAAYDGDPAAKSYSEIILCYPAFKAISNYRIAHELLTLGVPLIPRMISEIAHSETGIDIHPGAKIGERFTIDHGTGVVIGETCIIGTNVKLYQGVTLGAKSFELDEFGNPKKEGDRHPIIGDNVVIYANATILGRVTVGKDSVIGGNVWLTDDVEEKSQVTIHKPELRKKVL